MSEIIACPSGLSGRIRGMKVREERVLADRKLAKNGGQVDELLGACWEETLDPGPYDFGDKVIDWGQVLQGDRFYALLQIRALTYGPEYVFGINCQSEGCRARIKWELDLREVPELAPTSLWLEQKSLMNMASTFIAGRSEATGACIIVRARWPRVSRTAASFSASWSTFVRAENIREVR